MSLEENENIISEVNVKTDQTVTENKIEDLNVQTNEDTIPEKATSEITPPQDSTTENTFLFTPPYQAAPKSLASNVQNTEDDNLKFIKEQLNFLNNESGELATPIHKSNKQKRQDLARKHQDLAVKRKELRSPAKQFLKLHCRGIKRSPQKIKPRKPKRVCRSIGFADKLPEKDPNSSGAEADTSDDSSSEDNWKIIDSSDNEIDKAIEENATKQNLTVINIKNIIHQVITNEDVVAMVKNTLHDITEEDSESLLIPARYEPKMTRSKFKEVLEKDGTIHHPWPLSPLNKIEKPKTTFLELPLPDEDEDEDDEYNPDKEIELIDSDEDSESVASSQVSDLGSPRPSTPATPSSSISRFSDLDKTPSVKGDDGLRSPMGPPTKLPVSSHKSMLGKRFHMAMAESDMKAKLKEEETIALRTRSKLSLTETSLIELESSFVAPDITWDMYDTSCDDREWMTFLNGLQKLPENEDTNDDDNDPEYNYLAEVEEEDIDMEDFRCDRAVQVSRKEMNELMDELLEAYQDTDIMEEEEKELLKKKVMETVRSSSKKSTKTATTNNEVGLSESQKLQLDHQMRKHVQLLTQMYVLAAGNLQDYKDVKDHSKFLLNELHKFSEVNSTMTTFSAYKACNLEEAVLLVNDEREFTQIDPKNIIVNNRRLKKQAASPSKRGRKSYVEKDPSCLSPEKGIENMLSRNYKQLSEKKKDMIYNTLGDEANFNVSSSLLPKSILPVLTTQQKELFWKSMIFIYPEYIPHGSFLMSRDFTKSPRVCFTEAEDNLLALGFEQFRNLPFYRMLIQKFMLPCKTEDQIKIRIKNLTSKNSPDNPIKMYKTEKKMPDFPQCTDAFDVKELKPIMKHDASILPVWCKEMKIKEIILMSDDQLEGCNTIHRSSSVNIPVVQKRLARVDSNKCRSAPNTPLTQQESTRQLTPLKVLQFDTSRDVINPSSPKVTQLQDIGRRRCNSPGFIKLHDCPNLQQESPIPVSEKDLNSTQGRNTPVDDSQENTDSQDHSTLIQLSQGYSSPTHVSLNTSISVDQISVGHTETTTTPVIKSGAIMIMHGQTPITCAAPTFVVVNKMSSANLTGRIDSTVLSSALPSSICSVVQLDVDRSDKVISPTTIINDISREVQNELTPPKVSSTKRAADIVASYAPYYLSPELMKESSSCLSQQMQELTPTKNSPSSSRYRPVAPKPIVLNTFTSPIKKVSPFLEKKGVKSPRRKQLQTKALSIRPKGFVPNRPYVSPVKKAASNIINKALKRPKILLPKPFGMVSRPFHLHVRNSKKMKENEEEDISYLHEIATSGSEGMETDYMSGDCIDTMDLDEVKICDKPSVFSNRQKHDSGSNRSAESDDTQSEAEDANLYDSQNEDDVLDDEDHLNDLMVASSTICFASQRQSVKDKEPRRKGMNKKDTTIAMLAPDLLEVDPHKDDKDTAFAQAYLNRTKEALKENTEKYEQFLKILYDFGKSEQSPVKLYQDLQLLLVDYPDLVSDFAGFLLPEQAMECGCSMAAQEFKRAKIFLRKLEVYLARHPSHYQKVMKIFSRWSQSEKRNAKELRKALEPMLKMQPHLLEELSLFFDDERPPESFMTDYEEITLDDSDNEPNPDGYELVELPDAQDINGTKMCQCNCHKNTLDQNYLKRNRHCYSCCLKVIDGELYFRVSNKVLKKVNVIYHKPIKARSADISNTDQIPSPPPAWEEDDPIAEKENVDISLLPFNTKPNSSKKKKDKTRYLSGPEHDVYTSDVNDIKHYFEQVSNITTTDDVCVPTTDDVYVPTTDDVSVPTTDDVSVPITDDVCVPTTDDVCQQFHSPELNFMSEEAISSPKISESAIEVAASSGSSTFLYSMGDSTCPDILAKALKEAMISQGDVSMDVSLLPDNQNTSPNGNQNSFGIHLDNFSSNSNVITKQFNNNMSPMLSSSRSEKHFVKELFATSSDSSDSNNVKSIVTIADDMSNIGVIKSLDPSENQADIISTVVRTSDDSTLSQFKCSDNTKEKLPSVIEENEMEMLEKNEIPNLTFKTFGKDVKNAQTELCNFPSIESKLIPESSNSSAKSTTIVSHPELDLSRSRSNSRLSEAKNIESPKSIISIIHPEIESSVIGFSADSNCSVSMLHPNAEINRLTPRRSSVTKEGMWTKTTDEKGDRSQLASTIELSDSGSNSVDTSSWNKDTDRIILEAVKTHGPGSDTFDNISQKLPGKTSQQISQRFHELLEILANEETPSEEDTEDDKNSSN